jgi:hypothetical protein
LRLVVELIALLAVSGTTAPGLAPKPAPEWSEEQEGVEVDDYEEDEEDYVEYDPRDPRWLPYYEGDAIPPGYVRGQRIRVGWLIAGIAVFAGLYAYTAFLFSLAEGDIGEAILIPGLGPMIEAGRSEDGSTFTDTILVLDGVFQLAGVAVAIWAVADPKQLLIRADLAVTPVVGAGGGGLVLTKSF